MGVFLLPRVKKGTKMSRISVPVGIQLASVSLIHRQMSLGISRHNTALPHAGTEGVREFASLEK